MSAKNIEVRKEALKDRTEKVSPAAEDSFLTKPDNQNQLTDKSHQNPKNLNGAELLDAVVKEEMNKLRPYLLEAFHPLHKGGKLEGKDSNTFQVLESIVAEWWKAALQQPQTDTRQQIEGLRQMLQPKEDFNLSGEQIEAIIGAVTLQMFINTQQQLKQQTQAFQHIVQATQLNQPPQIPKVVVADDETEPPEAQKA